MLSLGSLNTVKGKQRWLALQIALAVISDCGKDTFQLKHTHVAILKKQASKKKKSLFREIRPNPNVICGRHGVVQVVTESAISALKAGCLLNQDKSTKD